MASPSFIILFCGTVSLNLSGMDSLFLFLLLTIASFLGSLIFYLLFPLKDKAPAAPCSKKAITSQSLNDIILDSFNTLFLIAGYVCLCCILCYALLQSLPVNPAVKSVFSGFIELTCGIASPARCRYQYGIKKSPVSSAGRLWRAFRPGPDLQHPERNRTFYYSLFCHQTSKRHYRCFLRVYLILYPLKRHLPEYDQNPPHSEPAAPVSDRPALLRKTVAPAGSLTLPGYFSLPG